MDELFDVVVVGAGSAGCALARRLTDDPSLRVALVEAGGEPSHPFIASPTEYFKLWGTEIDWDYQSVPQTGTAGRRHRLPRGRVLGGTSAINGMVYLRGARDDFDGWEQAGCAGWGWDQVRASYEQLEALVLPKVPDETNELSQVFIDAAQEAGLRFNSFFDDGDLEGCGWNRLSIHWDNGRAPIGRSSSPWSIETTCASSRTRPSTRWSCRVTESPRAFRSARLQEPSVDSQQVRWSSAPGRTNRRGS